MCLISIKINAELCANDQFWPTAVGPFFSVVNGKGRPRLLAGLDRLNLGSTYTSNEGGERQILHLFIGEYLRDLCKKAEHRGSVKSTGTILFCRSRKAPAQARRAVPTALRYLASGLPQLGKPSRGLLDIGREFRHFHHLPKLNHFVVGSGTARGPFHCLFL